MTRSHHHYSLTKNWIKAKSQNSKWLNWDEEFGYPHLYRIIFKYICVHWFSYANTKELSGIIEKTIDPLKTPFNFLFFKVIDNNLIDKKNNKSIILKTKKNKYFLKSFKSEINDQKENFILDLKNWSELSLSKNWRRNLMRSRKKSSKITYKNINIENYMNEVYEVIRENAKLKHYKYPYSLNFLNEIVKNSSGIIETFAAFNTEGKIIAVRSYFKNKDYAIDFIAAALPEALKIYVTYQLAFLLISKSKVEDINFYDLGGVNFIENKGVYNFKKGLGGKLIKDGRMSLCMKFNKYFPNILASFLIRVITSFL